MGTLTANIPRLAEHCGHKLPTSCRLTSTPLCCACADQRAHSSTYRVYIDGVGFVWRGTRWQNYCWFCKVFWDARVEASGLSSSQTQIPDTPDQTEFLERWYEFHQGYRSTISFETGRERRIAVTGEPLRHVNPGHLPRTLAELRAGQLDDRLPPLEQARTLEDAELTTNTATTELSLEETIDGLLQEANAEADAAPSRLVHDADPPTTLRGTIQAQTPVSANISIDPSDGESRPFQEAYEVAQETLAAAEARRAEHQDALKEAKTAVREARAELIRLRQQRISVRLRQQRISAANLTRAFGTREEVESDENVFPTTSMFTRVTQWGRRTEEQRRTLTNSEDIDTARRLLPNGSSERSDRRISLGGTHRLPSPSETRTDPSQPTPNHGVAVSQLSENLPLGRGLRRNSMVNSISAAERERIVNPTRQNTALGRNELPPLMGTIYNDEEWFEEGNVPERSRRVFQSTHEIVIDVHRHAPRDLMQRHEGVSAPLAFKGLDGDDRPEAKTEEEMTRKLDCQVCYAQIADMACLPCGHLAMCSWCADQTIPVKPEDKTRPVHKYAKCPLCRMRVKSRVKIFLC